MQYEKVAARYRRTPATGSDFSGFPAKARPMESNCCAEYARGGSDCVEYTTGNEALRTVKPLPTTRVTSGISAYVPGRYLQHAPVMQPCIRKGDTGANHQKELQHPERRQNCSIIHINIGSLMLLVAIPAICHRPPAMYIRVSSFLPQNLPYSTGITQRAEKRGKDAQSTQLYATTV